MAFHDINPYFTIHPFLAFDQGEDVSVTIDGEHNLSKEDIIPWDMGNFWGQAKIVSSEPPKDGQTLVVIKKIY